MNHPTLSTDLKPKVEKIGIYYEKLGFSPMAARVLGFLLVNETPFNSFQDIREFLGASKSSISNALNWLMEEGRVDYRTFSGDRKRYFKVNPLKWEKMIKDRFANENFSSKFLPEVVKFHAENEHIEYVEGLKRIIAIETFFQQKMLDAVKEWEKINP